VKVMGEKKAALSIVRHMPWLREVVNQKSGKNRDWRAKKCGTKRKPLGTNTIRDGVGQCRSFWGWKGPKKRTEAK